MGCTYEIVTVKMKKREHIEIFSKMFNELLKEDFYDEDFEILDDEIEEYDGEFQLQIDEEPLFGFYDEGGQIEYVVCEFLKKVSNAECVVEYHCTFNNCGDALYVKWNYLNQKFTVTRCYGEVDAIDYCPKCDTDFYEALCYLQDYDPEADYICPECGEKLEIDASKIIEEMILMDGEWVTQNK